MAIVDMSRSARKKPPSGVSAVARVPQNMFVHLALDVVAVPLHAAARHLAAGADDAVLPVHAQVVDDGLQPVAQRLAPRLRRDDDAFLHVT